MQISALHCPHINVQLSTLDMWIFSLSLCVCLRACVCAHVGSSIFVLLHVFCVRVCAGASGDDRSQECVSPAMIAVPHMMGQPLQIAGHPPCNTGYGMLWIYYRTAQCTRGQVVLTFVCCIICCTDHVGNNG